MGPDPLDTGGREMVKRIGDELRAAGKGAVSVVKESALLYRELLRTLLGLSERDVPVKDARFADPAWRENPAYRRLAQSYLAFCESVDRIAGDSQHWRDRERARFLGGVLTSTLAPTNTLLGNPAALKRVAETGGLSLLSGIRNLIGDAISNKRLPSQVDSSTFKVGENLAATPGAVVFSNEMLELIQYQPMTPEVSQRPTLLVAPPIGKYYFMDLAPGRSFIEYAVSRGIPMFATSWRNPGPEYGHWGLDDYVQALLDAVDAVCDISQGDELNILGMCAGGILSTLMLTVMAARGDKRATAAAFGVMMPDVGSEAPIGGFNIKPVLSIAKQTSAAKGILPASSLATVFAWMRPNDLVWNYWSNNYLLGKDPPAFDILAWSVDGTNLPAKLHEQFIEIFEGNALSVAGALRVLDVPVDLKRIRIRSQPAR
jgi:polyhydroxyalkanoate synthase